MQAVRDLLLAVEPTNAILALDPTPFPSERNPVWWSGVARIIAKLVIERVDDLADVEYIWAGKRDATTAEIRVGKFLLGEFYDKCRRMATGDGDFSVGVPWQIQRKLKAHGQHVPDVWFWGDGNVHGANTF